MKKSQLTTMQTAERGIAEERIADHGQNKADQGIETVRIVDVEISESEQHLQSDLFGRCGVDFCSDERMQSRVRQTERVQHTQRCRLKEGLGSIEERDEVLWLGIMQAFERPQRVQAGDGILMMQRHFAQRGDGGGEVPFDEMHLRLVTPPTA